MPSQVLTCLQIQSNRQNNIPVAEYFLKAGNGITDVLEQLQLEEECTWAAAADSISFIRMNSQLGSELHIKQFVSSTTLNRGTWYVWAIHFSGVQFNTWSYEILSIAILDLIMAVIQKCLGLRHHFPWPPKCRDGHQIHHHISLSRRIMYKNGCLMAAILNIQDGGQKVFDENGNIRFCIP